METAEVTGQALDNKVTKITWDLREAKPRKQVAITEVAAETWRSVVSATELTEMIVATSPKSTLTTVKNKRYKMNAWNSDRARVQHTSTGVTLRDTLALYSRLRLASQAIF